MKRKSKMTIEERRAYDKAWYEKNRSKVNGWRKRRTKELAAWFLKMKSNLCCSSCPENHPACLDFHHVGEKLYEVGDMARLGFGRKKIMEEISKCVVLCANCHRKHHFSERGLIW